MMPLAASRRPAVQSPGQSRPFGRGAFTDDRTNGGNRGDVRGGADRLRGDGTTGPQRRGDTNGRTKREARRREVRQGRGERLREGPRCPRAAQQGRRAPQERLRRAAQLPGLPPPPDAGRRLEGRGPRRDRRPVGRQRPVRLPARLVHAEVRLPQHRPARSRSRSTSRASAPGSTG